MKHGRILLVAAALAPLANLPAQDEQASSVAESPPVVDARLPDVVITATRDEDSTENLPYFTESITEDELRVRLAPRSLPDALGETPGVSVQKTAPGLESPFLRGFTGFRTLLLIDGIRVNNAVFRDGPNQYWGTVDTYSIGRLETVLGPSSVLYGSDAIGGTVNAITVEDFRDGVHPGLSFRFASGERSHSVRADVRGRDGDVGYAAGGTWRDFGNIRAGRHVGEQDNTGYDALAGDVKLRWDASERLALTFAHQSYDADAIPRTHSTDGSISWRGTRLGSDRRRDFEQERFLTYARADYQVGVDWLESATFTLSHQLLQEREDRIRSSGARTRQGFSDDTIGVLFAADSPSPIGDWTWGAEYYLDVVDSHRKDYDASGALTDVFSRGTVADDALYGQLGVFVQDRYAPVEWAEVVIGGRYNLIHAKADGEDIDPNVLDNVELDDLSDTWQALVGSARVIFHPYDWLSPFVGVSQGFRAPNLSDLTRFDVARSGVLETPNTDLDPERFLTFEVGSHLRGESWRVTGAYHYTHVRDLIVRFETGRTVDGLTEVDKDNVGDGYVYGFDFGGEWEFWEDDEVGALTAFGNFSFVESRVDQINPDGEEEPAPMSKGPPTSILVGLRWMAPSETVWLEATYRYVFEQDRLSFADVRDDQRIPPGGTPGYRLLGLRGHWQASEAIGVFAAVENINDEDYRVHGSGSNGPGVNFVAGMDARW